MVKLYQAVVCLISPSVFQGARGLPGCSAGYSKVFASWTLQLAHGWYYQCHAMSCWKRGCLGLAEGIFDLRLGTTEKSSPSGLCFLLLRAVHRSPAHLACQEFVAQTASQIATDLAWLFSRCTRVQPDGASLVLMLSGMVLPLMVSKAAKGQLWICFYQHISLG